jgi:tellurite resistance protein TerC
LAWVLVALAFNIAIYFLYSARVAPAGASGAVALLSRETASQEFLAAYVTELCLSLDSVFVIAAIFSHFRLAHSVQRKVLWAGIVVAIAARATMIWGAWGLLSLIPSTRYVLAGLLVLAALRMIVFRPERVDTTANPLVRLLRRFWPSPEGKPEDHTELFQREGKSLQWTALLPVLLLVETADAGLALDSIPAQFALARDPFLVLTANLLALFAARSFVLVLMELQGWMRYAKIGLALLLGYAAVAMARNPATMLSPELSLAVIAITVSIGLGLALALGQHGPATRTSPLGQNAERLATTTLAQARKVIAFVIGGTIVIIGLVMVPGPGPGLLVLPVGLTILAMEFVWARKLLTRFNERARVAGTAMVRTPRPWLIPFVIAGVVTFVTLGVIYGPRIHKQVTPLTFVLGSVPLVVGATVWCVVTWRRAQQMKKSRPKT